MGEFLKFLGDLLIWFIFFCSGLITGITIMYIMYKKPTKDNGKYIDTFKFDKKA